MRAAGLVEGGLLALALLAGCRHEPARPGSGPIVLVTFDGLRADMVGSLGGEKGLTPNFDRLAAGAAWAGRAIAPSSWTVPSMASLWTGLRPWQHQAIGPARPVLSADLLTLPEALQAAGYRTRGFPSGPWLTPRSGYGRGFDELVAFGDGEAAAARLAHLSSGREFVWIHIPEPHVPWVRRPWLRDNLPGALQRGLPGGLPRSVDALDLADFSDPQKPLAGDDRESYRALYLLNVVWADIRLGLLLDAIQASGQWGRTLLVVTAAEGEALGEDGQVLTGGDLGRELIEVPLAIKLPAGPARGLAPGLSVRRGERPATQRLFATLLEAAGEAPAPAVAPSLWRGARAGGRRPLRAGSLRALPLRGGEPPLAGRWRRPAPLGDALRAAIAGAPPRELREPGTAGAAAHGLPRRLHPARRRLRRRAAALRRPAGALPETLGRGERQPPAHRPRPPHRPRRPSRVRLEELPARGGDSGGGSPRARASGAIGEPPFSVAPGSALY